MLSAAVAIAVARNGEVSGFLNLLVVAAKCPAVVTVVVDCWRSSLGLAGFRVAPVSGSNSVCGWAVFKAPGSCAAPTRLSFLKKSLS